MKHSIFELEVLAALAESKSDWRTSASIAKQLRADEAYTRAALLELQEVRRPLMAMESEKDWHRLVNRGLTWQERWRDVVALISRDYSR